MMERDDEDHGTAVLPFAPARCLYVIVGDPVRDPEPETPFAHVPTRLIDSAPALRTIALLPVEIHECAAPSLYSRIAEPLVPRHALAFLRSEGLAALLAELRRYPFVAFFLLERLIPPVLAEPVVGHIVRQASDPEAGKFILAAWKRDGVRAVERVAALGWPRQLMDVTRESAVRMAEVSPQPAAAPYAVPPHRCLQSTGYLINRAAGYWAEDCHGTRGKALSMADTAKVLVASIEEATTLHESPRSLGRDAYVIVPAFNPHYYKGLQGYVSSHGGPRRFVADLVNNTGYLQTFSDVEDAKAERVATAAAGIRLREVEFHDASALVYAASRHVPVIRAPQVSGTLFQEMDRIANLKWSRATISKSVERWYSFGERLTDAVGTSLIDWLANRTRKVLAYCDLPIEWAMSDGVPLGYLTRVNRIPLSPGNVPVMPAIDGGPAVEWKDISDVRILICDAHDDSDPLRRTVPGLAHTAREIGFETHVARVDSQETLIASLEQFKPQIMVFSGHGDVVPGGAALAFVRGEGHLRVDSLPFTPDAAIIAACRSDAVTKTYGSPASRLYMAGVKAVVGTYLKISEPHATLVISSILSYLESGISGEQNLATFGEAVASALHLRRPVDILVAAGDWCAKHGVDPSGIMNLFSDYVEEYKNRRVARTKRELWKAVETSIVRISAGTPFQEAIETVVEHHLYRPESLFYTILGDADRIVLGSHYPPMIKT